MGLISGSTSDESQKTEPSNTDATNAFESALEESEKNISAANEPKRGRGRPRKTVGEEPSGEQESTSIGSRNVESASPGPIPISSGFPKGSLGRAWKFGAATIAAQTGFDGFKLTDEEKELLEEATEPVAAKYFPADNLEERPVLGLIFAVAMVFGPKTLAMLSEKQKAVEVARKQEAERIARERSNAQPEPFPVVLV